MNLTNILNTLSGGRPMQRVEHRFTDVVSGKPVYLYEDRLGRRWLAEHGWSIFRVPARG